MSYDPINPPRDVVQLGFTHLQGAAGTAAAASLAARMWLYESLDTHPVVGAPAYFADAGKRGMALGDIVIVRCTATGEVTKHSVLALAASTKNWDSTPGAASLSRIGPDTSRPCWRLVPRTTWTPPSARPCRRSTVST